MSRKKTSELVDMEGLEKARETLEEALDFVREKKVWNGDGEKVWEEENEEALEFLEETMEAVEESLRKTWGGGIGDESSEEVREEAMGALEEGRQLLEEDIEVLEEVKIERIIFEENLEKEAEEGNLRKQIEAEFKEQYKKYSKEDKQEEITKSIEFPPEYHQAGMNILSYFGDIVRKKYKREKIILKIEQEGLTVRMIIKSPDGGIKERIEETLESYLMVITGDKKPEDLLDSKLEILDLKNQLTSAFTMVKVKEEILLIEREHNKTIVKEKDKMIDSLEEFKGVLLKSISDDRDTKLILEIRKLTETNNKPVSEALEVISQKIEKGINPDDKEAIKKAYETIKKDPTVLERIDNLFLAGAGAVVGGYFKKWLGL